MDVEARLAQHLATLGSPYMSAFPPVFTWHGTVEIDDLFGTIDRWLQSLGIRPESWSQPVDGRDLISRLHEVDDTEAVSTLVAMTSTTQAYGMPGPFTAEVAAAYGEQLARLLGASNRRWWTNTDSSHTGWDPVTTHTFDALLVGYCDHLGAAILAIDED